jgi:hypothetical protein
MPVLITGDYKKMEELGFRVRSKFTSERPQTDRPFLDQGLSARSPKKQRR